MDVPVKIWASGMSLEKYSNNDIVDKNETRKNIQEVI